MTETTEQAPVAAPQDEPVDIPAPGAQPAAEAPAAEQPAPEEARAETPEQPAVTDEDDGEGEETEKKKPSHAQRLKRRIQAIASEATELARQNEELRKRLETASDPTK